MFAEEKKFKTFDLRFLAKKKSVQKNLGKIITCQKLVLSQKCLVKKFLVKNDSAPKMFWVQRNLEFKEIWAERIWLI